MPPEAFVPVISIQELRCISYRNDPDGLWALREESGRSLRVFLAAAKTANDPQN